MNKNPKISILIPIYNGLPYLCTTIPSILEQSFEDFEIVLVDDFSTDGSFEYLQNLAEKDKRIKLIKRKTKGGDASKGISYGLPFCSGEYFFYMSQDDFISKDALKACFEKCEKYNADICILDTVAYTNDKIKKRFVITPPNNDYEQEMAGKEAFYLSIKYIICGYALRKMKLVKQVGQDDKYYDSCDKSMAFQYFFANKIVFCSEKFYCRTDNKNAITKLFSTTQIHHLDTCNEVLEFSIKNQIPRKYIKSMINTFITRRTYMLSKILISEQNSKEMKEVFKNSLKEFKKFLLNNHFYLLYIKNFIKQNLSKSILRSKIYMFLIKHKLTNNFIFRYLNKKIKRKLQI